MKYKDNFDALETFVERAIMYDDERKQIIKELIGLIKEDYKEAQQKLKDIKKILKNKK